jgi:hypothetical protein
MRRDTINQMIAAGLMVVCMAASAVLAVGLTSSGGRNKLVYTDRAVDGDPPEVAAGIALGAFRGLFVNILWIRANDLKEEGRFYEAMDLANMITRLQPRFPHVWVFHAWNMAYNISVSTQTPQERWQWVQAGVNLLRNQGIPANPSDLLLHKELAWIFLHKIGGYMDDANLHYRRWLAAEWSDVLGPPPPRDVRDRDLAFATKRYADWLRPIAEAPEAPEDVVAREPSTRELVKVLRERAGLQPDFNLARYYSRMTMVAKSGFRAYDESRMAPQEREFLAIVTDPQHAKAWEALIPFLRRRMLIDVYHMEPERMLAYTEKYGPLDWRHYASHALYWGERGVENAQLRVGELNKTDFDFTNSGRIVVQALQELWRSSDVSYDYMGFIRSPESPGIYYNGSPNIHFIESYGKYLNEYIALSIFDRKSRVYNMYAAGYENFVKDAIRYLYRRGDKARAQKMKDDLAGWEWRNMNDDARTEQFALSLDDFVKKELEDALTRPSVAREEVVGALQGAFTDGLLGRDSELFRSQVEYAGLIHAYFFSQQGYKNNLDPHQLRMAQMDPDFGVQAGTTFALFLRELDLDEAARAFDEAPPDLRLYGYDAVVEKFKVGMDELAKAGNGRPFAMTFPEPPGLDEFRRVKAARERERGRMPGVELK